MWNFISCELLPVICWIIIVEDSSNGLSFSQVKPTATINCQMSDRQTRSKTLSITKNMEEFRENFLDALENTEVAERLQLVPEPVFTKHLEPLTKKLSDTVAILSQTVTSLKKEVEAKDRIISDLRKDVTALQCQLDDIEQHGRKESVRVFGLPKTTAGTTDEKFVNLCNDRMKLEPPLDITEIAVSHRVGPIQQARDDGLPLPPRPLLVKFVSRRSKATVMEVRKNHRQRRPNNRPHNQESRIQLRCQWSRQWRWRWRRSRWCRNFSN